MERVRRERDSSVREKHGDAQVPRARSAYHSWSSMTNRELCSPIIFYFSTRRAREQSLRGFTTLRRILR